MSALARLLLAEGKSVSGSDKQESAITRELTELGARIFIGHQSSNVNGAAALVISTAITEENPELLVARQSGLPILHRSDVLSYLSLNSKLIGISGTHGKTTTTGMVAQVLLDGGLEPSVVVGGIFDRIGANACHGKGDYFVAEIDESDRTQVTAQSYISVITNIEADHLENYPGGLEQIYEVMAAFANNSRKAVVLCADDAGCRAIMPSLDADKRVVVTYGKSYERKKLNYSYSTINGDGIDRLSMQVFKDGETIGTVSLSVPGEHNRLNALAAVAVGLELGIDFEQIAASLKQFTGVDRRFQVIGEESNILIIDDYAHHPTEVKATLQAAKQYIRSHESYRRVVAVFQPHQPGRLRDFWEEFCQSFSDADVVLISDVYVARGGAIEGITSEQLVKDILHDRAHHLVGSVKELVPAVMPYLKPHDLVLTIGAGDITQLGREILRYLRQGHHGRTG